MKNKEEEGKGRQRIIPDTDATHTHKNGSRWVKIMLTTNWDAVLTYDLLESSDTPSGSTKKALEPVFVGREELLGPIVNAIGQPDLRGTFLVSGYRGAGKTSLVIEAARRGQARLQGIEWELLPLVLNVSEVSASLDSASELENQPLRINARRLLTAHVRRYHRRYGSSGYVWQGRFKAFPIQEDDHLLTVLPYTKRNPLRAGLVSRAEERPWSSLQEWGRDGTFLDPGPVPRSRDWVAWVNEGLTEAELERTGTVRTVAPRLGARRGRRGPRDASGWRLACVPAADRASGRKSRMSPFSHRSWKMERDDILHRLLARRYNGDCGVSHMKKVTAMCIRKTR